MKTTLSALASALCVLTTSFAQDASPKPAASPAPTATPASASPRPQATPTAAPTATPQPAELSTREIIDRLSSPDLERAIDALRTNFLKPSLTDDSAVRRATLEGLISRLSPGVSLTTTQTAGQMAAKAPSFLAEILDGRIGYLRLGAIGRNSLAQIDAALASFKGRNLGAVILDLRGVPPSYDYEAVADLAGRFCPKGKVLFSVEKPSAKQERILTSSQDPAFSGVLVVLTDQRDAGAAEVLAATLRQNANAMIVGETTRGEGVEFSDLPLGDGTILRVAVAQVVLPAAAPIFPDGVKPDISAALDPDVQEQIFALSKEKGVSQFVFDTERPHLNEAALVANTNPEIDPGANRQASRDALRDTVLQRAVDLITAITFYNGRAQK
ncbi:MAG TPA: S41 family peptidase [Chthoniobacterales bacterium]